jgi:hypothetical protein
LGPATSLEVQPLKFNARRPPMPGNCTSPRRWSAITPAKAGVQSSLGSGFRRSDEIGHYASDFTGFASGLSAFKEMRLPWPPMAQYPSHIRPGPAIPTGNL